ncbi:zinc-ribbon domain-containing protein [[Eubacterium] cellulosolvens]
MSEKQSKSIPTQKLTGMQVVDSKGAIIGSVKDLAIVPTNREILLLIETKDGNTLEISLSDVSSIEDVILLAKSEKKSLTPPLPIQASVKTIACNTCGASLPAHAKFCAKCGSQLK